MSVGLKVTEPPQAKKATTLQIQLMVDRLLIEAHDESQLVRQYLSGDVCGQGHP